MNENFKPQTREIAYEMTWTWIGKGNLKRNRISFNHRKKNTIRTNYFKAKIDYTQQNCKCALCGDSDEKLNQKISECSNLAQKK